MHQTFYFLQGLECFQHPLYFLGLRQESKKFLYIIYTAKVSALQGDLARKPKDTIKARIYTANRERSSKRNGGTSFLPMHFLDQAVTFDCHIYHHCKTDA